MGKEKLATMTVEQVAQVLGIGRALAYRLAATGHIGPVPVLRIGRRLLIPRRALERVLNGNVIVSEDDNDV